MYSLGRYCFGADTRCGDITNLRLEFQGKASPSRFTMMRLPMALRIREPSPVSGLAKQKTSTQCNLKEHLENQCTT
jgi:hypothetical protein